MRVTVVTISYSKRWDLLRKTLQAALEQGAERAIVVDNEADEEIAPRAADAFGDRVRTLRLEKNRGSAGAYDVGLRAAMADGAEFLLMLDDDNCLATGSLAMLLDVYGRLAPDRSLKSSRESHPTRWVTPTTRFLASMSKTFTVRY